MVEEEGLSEFVCTRCSNNLDELWRMPLVCVTLKIGFVNVQHFFQKSCKQSLDGDVRMYTGVDGFKPSMLPDPI